MHKTLLRLLPVAALLLPLAHAADEPFELEKLKGKTILLFTPHPDDDTFCCGGTLKLLQQNGNNIHIFIYTNDDKGSYDREMSSQRLARIRMGEEEAACKILGIPKTNIHWLQFDDGMLEYANTRDLVEQVTGIIRKFKPDVVLSPEPGTNYVRWHKTDHRMAANNTIDAVRAAEWHLYFPNQLLHDGLEPWIVPHEVFYYVTPREANYWVNIDSAAEAKIDASLAHVSQWEPAITHYRPDWDPQDLEKLKAELRAHAGKKDGHHVEAFRIATGFNQE